MDIALYAVYIIGFLVAIKLLTYGLLVKALLGIRFKKGDCVLHDLSDLPSYLKDMFDVYEEKLVNLGFVFSHCQICDEIVVNTHSKKWDVVYFNSTEECYASVCVSPMPDQNYPAKVEFVSFFSDGSKLLTINGMAHEIIDVLPNIILVDPYAESLELQFQSHIARLSELKHEKSSMILEPIAYAANEKKTMDDYITSLEAKGFIKKTEDSYYQLGVLATFQHGYKALKGLKKFKAMQAKIRRQSQVHKAHPAEVPIEVEVEAFSRMQELLKPKKTGYAGKAAVFLVSLLLFMLAFGISFSINTVMVFICAVFIHELGHFLGMRLFKYKDVQVLFLPFIGGATLGGGRKATALQRVIVYLLGPAPGIIIGTICLLLYQAYSIEFLKESGLFLVILNYINLLPIIPLDGGRIFELILFSRISFLKSTFLILSMVILAIAGLSIGEPVLLIIPLFLFISLRSQILQNRGLSRLNKKIKAE
ncbi:MAG: site-2 protease family protein, partial [Planctomycetota bacterium]